MPEFFSSSLGNADKLLSLTGFIGLRSIVYSSHELDQLLKPSSCEYEFKPDALIMLDPDRDSLQAISDASAGFQYTPIWITWEQPVACFEDHINNRYSRLHKSPRQAKKRLDDFNRKIEKTDEYGIRVTIRELTVDDWHEFYDNVYIPWVVMHKSAGFDYAGRDFAAVQLASKERRTSFRILLMRDSRDGNQLVGGTVLEDFGESGTLKIKFAAFSRDEKYRRLSLSYRAYFEANSLALCLNCNRLSYGTEPNLYAAEGDADMITTGLHNFKSSLCFEPIVLDIPGYRERRVFRFVSPEWTVEKNCFFYRYSQDLNSLDIAHIGKLDSKGVFPPCIQKIDLTADIRSRFMP